MGLKILENFDLAGMGLLSADAVHVMVEAKKLAFADRERWAADPRSLAAPLGELLSADYAARLAARVLDQGLPERTLLNVNVPPGRPAGVAVTVQGRREHEGTILEALDPRGGLALRCVPLQRVLIDV